MQRQRYSAEQWAAWFEECDASGLTIAEFCRVKGVSVNSYYVWRRKLRDAASEPAFVAVEIAATNLIQIDLPGGATLRVPNHAESLRPVLEVLVAIGGQR
ncbi:MAG: transposase [Planctomycetota bacterium]